MKKLIFSAVALATVMLTGACQKEVDFLAGDTNVTFTVSTGEIATKAEIADGKNIDILYWELYGANPASEAGPLGEGEVRDSDGDKEFTLNLKLVADQDYNIVFWAQVDGKNHYVVEDLRSVKIKTYSDEKANDETRAAFFAVYPFHTENGAQIKQTVYLKRPFSQLNLGATNYETSLNKVNGGKIVVSTTEVTVTEIANSFNTISGKGEVDLVTDPSFTGVVTFEAAATPNGVVDQTEKKLEVNDQTYYWLGMNYLIVTGDSDNVVVDMTVVTNMGTIQHTVDNVPIKENYRTNILGNLLTTYATFKVVVDEEFIKPDYNVGLPEEYEYVAEGLYKDFLGAYHVTNAAGLAYFSNTKAVDGTIINLDTDIDFAGAEFKAIAADYGKSFTFNGNNHTVSNIKLVESSHNSVGAASLFFCYTDGKIRVNDLVVDNAQLADATYAGVILGYTQGDALLKDITVKNSSVTADKKVGGLVGFIEASTTSFVAENCHVVNTTVVATQKQAGTIIGYNAKPATLINCSADAQTTASSPQYCDNGIRSTDPAQAELIVK